MPAMLGYWGYLGSTIEREGERGGEREREREREFISAKRSPSEFYHETTKKLPCVRTGSCNCVPYVCLYALSSAMWVMRFHNALSFDLYSYT